MQSNPHKKVDHLDEPRPAGRKKSKKYPLSTKQRLDELKSAEDDFWFWFNIRERDKADKFNCKYKAQNHRGVGWSCYHGWDHNDDWFKRIDERYSKLWTLAKQDGII